MDDFKELLELPGASQEQAWLEERLETLSVREKYVLAAAIMRHPPETAADAINCLQSLAEYSVCQAGNYEELGQLYLHEVSSLPEDVLPYVDFDQIGKKYEDLYPGLFVGSCYLVYPQRELKPVYSPQSRSLPEDNDWSVKLKLASPAVPDGVWLRLPVYDGMMTEKSTVRSCWCWTS